MHSVTNSAKPGGIINRRTKTLTKQQIKHVSYNCNPVKAQDRFANRPLWISPLIENRIYCQREFAYL